MMKKDSFQKIQTNFYLIIISLGKGSHSSRLPSHRGIGGGNSYSLLHDFQELYKSSSLPERVDLGPTLLSDSSSLPKEERRKRCEPHRNSTRSNSLFLFGLASDGVYPAGRVASRALPWGGTGPVVPYRETTPRCALTAPFHPYRPDSRAGGIFSVALSVGLRRLPFRKHPAL